MSHSDKPGQSSSSQVQASTGEGGLYPPPPQTSLAFPDDPFTVPQRRHGGTQHVLRPTAAGPPTESLGDWAKQTRFTVLNHFSHVTNVARNGAHTLLSSPLFQQPSHDDGANRTSSVSLATSLLQHGPVGPFGPNAPDWKHSEIAQKSGTGDFDSAHVYLARWAKIVAEEGEANRTKEAEARRAMHKAAMDVEESELGSFEVWDRMPHIDRPETTRSRDNAISASAWRSLFEDDGRPRVSKAEMKAIVFQQGFGKGKERMTGTHWDQLDPRAECWSFLLDAQTWSVTSTRAERRSQWNDKAEQYWAIKTQHLVERSKKRDELEEEGPEEQFWREQQHRVHVDCLRVDRKLPFFEDQEVGDCDDDDNISRVNAHAQRLEEILLSYVAWDRMREAALPESAESEPTPRVSHRRSRYEASERGLLGGYVQGMSDLCAPLYAVCHGDEAKTFWLLVGMMQRVRRNFYSDQSGMKTQLTHLQNLLTIMDASLHAHLDQTDGLNLFFCFRWLLVCFKREFNYPDILMLWEAIWAAELSDDDEDAGKRSKTILSDQFQIFIAFAILEQQRDVVIKYLQHFDEILQYMNGLSGQIDVDVTIAEAQVLCLSLRNVITQHDSDVHDGCPTSTADGKQNIHNASQQAAALAAAAHVAINDNLRSLVGKRPQLSPPPSVNKTL